MAGPFCWLGGDVTLAGMHEHSLRERQERREEALSPFAARSKESRGRGRPEEPDAIRTAFQRDRDRIIYSKAFRRLKHKTQVFIAPLGDHYVTRLTHTLEVSQIARTIARALNLNEDLTEAIALGHDLGHTPFGHIGEDALDQLHPGGFHHSQQSLRVVDLIEHEGEGLNLTWEVRQGIVSHSKPRSGIQPREWHEELTLEGQVVRIADAVAYINHDLMDAMRARIIGEEDPPREATAVLGDRHSQRINTLVTDIVKTSWSASGEVHLPGGQIPVIQMSPLIEEAADQLREFLFQRVYIPISQGREAESAREVLQVLYCSYSEHSQEIPMEFHHLTQDAARMAVDYIAGMTDRFALRDVERFAPGLSRGFSDQIRF